MRNHCKSLYSHFTLIVAGIMIAMVYSVNIEPSVFPRRLSKPPNHFSTSHSLNLEISVLAIRVAKIF